MAGPTPSPDTALRLTRSLPAPRDKVFRAWTDPEALTRWWGPDGYATPIAEVDLRVGGGYRLGMRKLPAGELFYLVGTYREVRPPERLVYTWRWEAEPELGETLVTVEFHDRGDRTEIVLTQEFFPNAQVRQDHVKGWTGCLDRLAAAL